MTTRLLLVRHGATTLSAEDRFAGSTDVALSDEGRHQAARLGTRLADDAIAAVYCSPMRRTIETAALIAEAHKLAPVTRPGLREIDHGHWEGLTRQEVEQRFGDGVRPLGRRSVHGGASGRRMRSGRHGPRTAGHPDHHRVAPGQNVLVVSHKATIRLVISSLLGFDARGYRDRLDQAPACLNVLDFKDPVRARLMLFNDISHYADHPHKPTANLSKWWQAVASSQRPSHCGCVATASGNDYFRPCLSCDFSRWPLS